MLHEYVPQGGGDLESASRLVGSGATSINLVAASGRRHIEYTLTPHPSALVYMFAA